MTFFDVHLDTKGIIRNAIKSNIYLGRMMDSLYSTVIAIPNEANTTEDVLRKYEAFFEVLRKELEERSISRVEIGQAFDVTGCELVKTIELTPNGLFTCENGRQEVSKCPRYFWKCFSARTHYRTCSSRNHWTAQ